MKSAALANIITAQKRVSEMIGVAQMTQAIIAPITWSTATLAKNGRVEMLINSLKSAIRQEIGKFSKREFRQAYIYALHKYRNNPHINEKWYLATVIGEIIRQNRFSLYCLRDMQQKRAVHA